MIDGLGEEYRQDLQRPCSAAHAAAKILTSPTTSGILGASPTPAFLHNLLPHTDDSIPRTRGYSMHWMFRGMGDVCWGCYGPAVNSRPNSRLVPVVGRVKVLDRLQFGSKRPWKGGNVQGLLHFVSAHHWQSSKEITILYGYQKAIYVSSRSVLERESVANSSYTYTKRGLARNDGIR